MLISAIMVTAVMGVAITAKQGGGKDQRRMMFNQGIAQLSAQLKAYVTACGCNPTGGACPAPACTMILGPNRFSNAGVATWYLNSSNPALNPVKDSMGNVYALTCGAHTVTGVVPALEAPPYNGAITYTVAWPGGVCPNPLPPVGSAPQVTFTANWTEP